MTWIALACAGLALTVFIALAYVRRWRWAGFAASKSTSDDEQPAKTLWDWLQLLVIPIALAALAFLLNNAQSNREQRREDQRSALQRATARDAAREDSLRAYLTQMSGLMLDRNLRSRPAASVVAVARTLTLTALRQLDRDRKAVVVRFLHEARLLESPEPKVGLTLADLRRANLRGADLVKAHLQNADLRGADLKGAELQGAVLVGADLEGANLVLAHLFKAHLEDANLQGANLVGADLRRTVLARADLRGADLRGAIFPLQRTDLSGAKYDSLTRWTPGFNPAAAGARKGRPPIDP